MRPNTILKVVDDIRIVVPDSLNLITTCVLCEQKDWFEDEIKFVRLLLKPQDNAIDIGASPIAPDSSLRPADWFRPTKREKNQSRLGRAACSIAGILISAIAGRISL